MIAQARTEMRKSSQFSPHKITRTSWNWHLISVSGYKFTKASFIMFWDFQNSTQSDSYNAVQNLVVKENNFYDA